MLSIFNQNVRSGTDSVHVCQLYRVAPLGNQASSTRTLISHSVILYWHWINQPMPYSNNAECLARKRQVSILKSLIWLDHGSNQLGSDSPISQNGRQMFYSFDHLIWTVNSCDHYTSIALIECQFCLSDSSESMHRQAEYDKLSTGQVTILSWKHVFCELNCYLLSSLNVIYIIYDTSLLYSVVLFV